MKSGETAGQGFEGSLLGWGSRDVDGTGAVPEKDGGSRAKRREEYKWNYNTSSEEGRKSWLAALSAGLKRQNRKMDCSMACFL